jgi:hypothetical protein
MPAEQGVWLDDEQGLLPRSNQPSQQDEEHAIGPGERWPLHLPLEDDQLLSHEGNFCDQLGLGPAQVDEGGEPQGGCERFRPTSQAGGECMPAAIQEPLEREKNTCHTRRFSIT